MTIPDAFLSLIIGASGSFLASMFFVRYLFLKKPNLEVSNKIAKFKSTPDQPYRYGFKIINRSDRDVINIKTRLELLDHINIDGGTIYRGRTIKLARSERFSLARFDAQDKEAHYAYRISTLDDIEALWDDNAAHLKLTILAQDSFSGFSKVFITEFHKKQKVLCEGRHCFGNNMDVA